MTTATKDQGLSLLDIGPIYEDVPLSTEKSLRVYGISAKGMFTIFQRFPEVAAWFKGGKFDVESLVKQVPAALSGIIAAGCGSPGNPIAEERADAIAVDSQLDVLEAIFRLSFKSGFGPFVLRIVALSAEAESLNYGRGLVTTSPKASQTASPPDTTAKPSGI